MNLLESIKVIDDKGYDFKQSTSTLLDKIYLDICIYYEGAISGLKICYFNDTEWTIIDPIFQSFKRITPYHFTYKEDTLAKLNMIKKANIIEAEQISFSSISLDNFVEVIDSSNFNYKIQMLRYWDKNWNLFNDWVLNNISLINPTSLQ